MDEAGNLKNLFHKYVENRCSSEELEELIDLLDNRELEILWNELIDEKLRSSHEKLPDVSELNDRLQSRLQMILSDGDIVNRRGGRYSHRWRWIAAASIIVVIGILGALIIGREKSPAVHETKVALTHDVMPGGNKAVLTLSNGVAVSLDSSHSGLLSQEGGSQVVNTADGMLSYDLAKGKAMVVYNTLTTPNGGQYKLRLPDGTVVWLNDASSIHYPTTFPGSERLVEITGEAYFEVVHNAQKPFVVKAGNQIIKDIGTHFNVNAYKGSKSIKTTLLEGGVTVQSAANSGTSVLLRPGQQAEGALNGNIHVRTLDDVNNVIAWQKGLFFFDDASIQEVMQQLAKWYDIKVNYEGTPSKKRFKGKIQRNIPLSVVLGNIGEESIHYRIENKTVTIYP